jgi:hypothetical protein
VQGGDVSSDARTTDAGNAPPSGLFDVDATLIDEVTGSNLRPHARTLLEALRSRGIRLLL